MTATVASVQILLTGVVGTPSDDIAQAYLDDAAAMIASCPCIANLPQASQDAIQKYLAAHLYTVAKNRGAGALTLDVLGDARKGYASPSTVGEGLKLTSYGQQALLFDTTGCLLNLGEKTAGFSVVTF